jgi:hypothetical protein
MKPLKITLGLTLALLSSGCTSTANFFNPFYETPSEVAYFGDKNDRALNDSGGGKSANARAALEQMQTYSRAHAPSPNRPVMQPAVVRLMWVPDHLNSHGDLVPDHYYYLKVLKERWAVQDAFELEAQLGGSNGNSSSIGFVQPEDLR